MVTLVAGSADEKLCTKWTENLKSAQHARTAFEKQWHHNLAFYHGRQWVIIDKSPSGSGFVLTEAPVTDKFRVRHTANRIKRIIRQEITKLSKEEPQFYVVPASTEDSDRAAAISAESISEYFMYSKIFNKKRTEATFWAVICGTSFLKNWYNEGLLELDGKPGRIDFEAVTPFHLFVPYLQEPDIQNQPWVIHAQTLSPEQVWDRWKTEVPPQTDSSSTIMDSRFLTSMGINQSKNKLQKMCYVKECWVKPCKSYPNGAMFVLADNKVLYVYEASQNPELWAQEEQQTGMPQMPGQLALPGFDSTDAGITAPIQNEGPPPVGEFSVPKSEYEGLSNYEHKFPLTRGHYPFAKIDHVPTGMFYADSVIKDLIPLQKEYNRTRSIMLEHRNMAGKPQWSYTKGAINPKNFNSKPGLLLAVNMGFDAPKPLEQPDMNPATPQELEIIQRDMDDVSAQFEISKGRTPPGVEAASAIAYLQEENDTIMYHTVQSLEAAVQETGVQLLSLVHDYWDPERIVSVTSRNEAYEVRKFKAANLKPLSDFRVEPGSMAPRSAAAKQAFMTELMKMGVVPPKKALKFLQMNETKALYEDLNLDDRHAQRENMRMAEGQELIRLTDQKEQVMDQWGYPTERYKPEMKMEVDEVGNPIIDEATGMPAEYPVTINSFDNHEVHIEVHQNFMKTQEFEQLPPEIQQIFKDHVDEHKMEIVKEMMYSKQGITGDPNNSEQPPGGPQEQPIQEGEVVSNAGTA